VLKGMFALTGAPKLKRIARITFWLALISAASRHDILLGIVLYPIAAFTVAAIGTCWLWVPGLLWLAWYHHRHGRLPGWISRRLPARLRRAGASARRIFRQARGRLMDVFPGHRRRPVRRRWPRHPAPWETPTEEFPVLRAPNRTAEAREQSRTAPPLP
jgi:hypothetical protein